MLVYALICVLTAAAYLVYHSLILSAIVAGLGAWIVSQNSRLLDFRLRFIAYAFGPMIMIVLLESLPNRSDDRALKILFAGIFYISYSTYFVTILFALRKVSRRMQSRTRAWGRSWNYVMIVGALGLAGRIIEQSTTAEALLAEKHKVMQMGADRSIKPDDLAWIFRSDGKTLRHAAGGEVAWHHEGERTELLFLNVPAGDPCWALAFINNREGFKVEVDSQTSYGPGSPKTAGEFSSFRSRVCGNIWSLFRTVTIKIIPPDPANG
jgi:hypothetical protein